MKKYISFFRIRFVNGLQYRVAALSGASTQFFWGFMLIAMYRAFYEADPAAFPMKLDAVVSYMWLQQAFLALYNTWTWENELFESIRSGNVAYDLCRPIALYESWYVRTIALRTSRALLRSVPILLVAFFLPTGFRLNLPAPGQLPWFILSMVLALLVVVGFQMVIYSLTFYMMNPQGLRILSQTLGDFLCGSVIPLPFFPDSIQTMIKVLPFASMQNAPLRIYSGDITGTALYETLLLQIFWVFALMVLGRFLMNRGLKKTVIQGG